MTPPTESEYRTGGFLPAGTGWIGDDEPLCEVVIPKSPLTEGHDK